METMIIENNIIKRFDSMDKKVKIPKGIRHIDKFAFENSPIEHIDFEDSSLKIIGDYAFRNATSLQEVILPDSVISIGTGAFKGCESLEYLYIPPSVIDIDGEILSDGCKTYIVGEKNTLAEEYAKSRRLLFKIVDQSIKKPEAEVNPISYEFNIFGVKVSCSKGYPIYLANKRYYAGKQTELYNSLLAMLPSKSSAQPNFDAKLIQKYCDTTADRLRHRDIIVTSDQILSMVSDSALSVIQIVSKYYQLATDVNNGLNTDISNMRNDLYAEAQSKITGVSYGVIGGPLDLMLYGIDNALEARKQYNRVSREASALDNQYTSKLVTQADGIMSKLYKEVQPLAKQAADSFLDALCNAENTLLSDAGIMNLSVINSVDESKSNRFFSSLTEKDEDADYKIGLALKHNPYNSSIYRKALEKGLVSEELLNMISFLGLDKDLALFIDQSFVNLYTSEKSISECINLLIDKWNVMSNKVTTFYLQKIFLQLEAAKENMLSVRIDAPQSSSEYCNTALNSIIDEVQYNRLIQKCEERGQLIESHNACPSYEQLLEEWVTKREKILKAYSDRKEITHEEYVSIDDELEYRKLKSLFPINDDCDDLDSIINRLERLKGYKDCIQMLERAKGIKYDLQYLDCIKLIEKTDSTQALDNIIRILYSMNGYKDSAVYIEKAKEKKALIAKEERKQSLEQYELKIENADSESQYEELENILRPLLKDAEYAKLFRKLIKKRNQGLRDKAEKALSLAQTKTDYLQIKKMLLPRKDELGINDLYIKVERIIDEFESAEIYDEMLSMIASAKTSDDYDTIINKLTKIRFYKDAENKRYEVKQMKEQFVSEVTEEINCLIEKAKTHRDLQDIKKATEKLPLGRKHRYLDAINKLIDVFDSLDNEKKELEVELSKRTSFFQGRERAEIKNKINLKEHEKSVKAYREVEDLRKTNKILDT